MIGGWNRVKTLSKAVERSGIGRAEGKIQTILRGRVSISRYLTQ